MQLSIKQNVAFAAVILSFVLGSTGFGGAITSANYPLPPPPSVIPGMIRLSCTLNVATFFGVLDREGSTPMNVAETSLYYEKAEGADYFKCVEGCEDVKWSKFRTEWPTGEVLPVPKVTLIGQIGLPSLRLNLVDSKLFLATTVSSAHRSWTGSIVSSSKQTVTPFDRRELHASAETEESFATDEYDVVRKLAKQLGKPAVYLARSSSDLRCTILKPGQMSEAQIARVFATPPRAGTISAQEYKSATSINNLEQPYTEVLDLARKLDPDHRKALIAEFAILRSNTDFLTPLAEKVREAVKANPKMTAGDAWDYIAGLLGIQPMSPSGIVIPPVVPLVIAEEDAVAK